MQLVCYIGGTPMAGDERDERNVYSIMELHDVEIGHVEGRLYVAFPDGHTEWPELQAGRVVWDQSFLVPKEVRDLVEEILTKQKEEEDARLEQRAASDRE